MGDTIKQSIFTEMAENLSSARVKYTDYWCAWDTFGGDHHEGVIYEIDNGTYHVLCTDGKERAV